jgi:CRP-like cAMP-binding protein
MLNQSISNLTQQVLKPYPSAVRRKILRKLYLKPLVQTQLMRGVRQQFVDAFLASCTVEIFSPGEEIVERGAVLSDLFLLVGGIAEIITTRGFGGTRSVLVEGDYVDSEDETRPRLTTLGPGDFIGEIAFFTESPQVDSVVTVTTCKTLTISQSTYKILVQDHPGSAGKILQNLLEKVESMNLRLPLPEEIPALRVGSVFNNAGTTSPSDLESAMDSTYDYGAFDIISNDDEEYFVKKEALTVVAELVRMHMSKQLDDQTTRLLFAASRGDTNIISLMCDQGFDPNNSDYDNRTALMVASMKGNTDIVRLLLVDYKVRSF